METDPFDEFDMRPITGGLGFHKKATQLKKAMKKVTQDSMGTDLPQPPPKDLVNEEKKDHKKTFDSLISSMNQLEKKGVTFIEAPPSKKTPQPTTKALSPSPHLQAIPLSLPSLLLDVMVATTVSLVFVLCFLMINDVHSLQVISRIQTDLRTQLSLFLMFMTIFIMYVVLTRGYFGRTLGEWTFECQMGQNHQIKKAYYPFLVLWRSLLVAISCFTLPIFSLITGRDITYYLTGLQLYRES